jgi:hypothetical protein
MPTVEKINPTFNDVTPYHGLFLFNEEIGDDGAGEEMPSPLTWNTASPVGDVDWSAFTVAVDAAGINRSNRAGCALVSPNYCVYATHANGDETGYTWMTPAGVEVTRTFSATNNLGNDLTLAKLSAVINNIDPMPIVVNSATLAGRYGLAIEMDRHLNRFQIPASLDNGDESCQVTRTEASDGLESGDSGKPFVILINGVAALVVTAFTSASPGGPPFTATGPNASHYITAINAILAGDGESLTLWDVIITGHRIGPIMSTSSSPASVSLAILGA